MWNHLIGNRTVLLLCYYIYYMLGFSLSEPALLQLPLSLENYYHYSFFVYLLFCCCCCLSNSGHSLFCWALAEVWALFSDSLVSHVTLLHRIRKTQLNVCLFHFLHQRSPNLHLSRSWHATPLQPSAKTRQRHHLRVGHCQTVHRQDKQPNARPRQQGVVSSAFSGQ